MTSASVVRPGSNFGPYRILEPLGRGGMATVYRAYEASLDRYVALKVLPGEALADPEFTGRFRREAKLIAALEHRHIVPIYAYGIDEGVPWMAMRLVAGGALSARLLDGPMALNRAIELLAEVGLALDFAHDHGVLHRDVKPQNVLLDGEGHAYLADFGVARMLEGTAAITRSGVVTGTPLYMSPEQARGEPVDRRTDIYALGIVAYEMLTGHVPFSADTPIAVLMKHIMEPLPLPPADLVPEPVLRAILKCVAKNPSDRWSSARHFMEALQVAALSAAADNRRAWASAQPTLTRFGRSRRRSVMGFVVTALGVATIGALLITGLRVQDSLPARQQDQVQAPPSAEPSARLPSPQAVPSRAVTASAPRIENPASAQLPAIRGPQGVQSESARGSSATLRAERAPVTASPGDDSSPAPEPSAASDSTSLHAQPDIARPPGVSAPTPEPGPIVDGVTFLIGRWNGQVRQRKNPFIHRELERPVRTECKRLRDPLRVLCKSDWGIIEDWLVIRHDIAQDRYWYEDSDGLRASASPVGDRVVYQGSRTFQDRPITWRLTSLRDGADAFSLRMEWSRNTSDWYTIYDASFRRSP